MTSVLEQLVREVYRAAERIFPKVRRDLEELLREVSELRKYVQQLPTTSEVPPYTAIAVDTGFLKLKYTNFAVALVVSCTLTSGPAEKVPETSTRAEPLLLRALKYSDLALHYISKVMEYEQLLRVLREKEFRGDLVVLLDGALTYPEELDLRPELRPLVRKYVEKLTEFLRYCEERRERIHIVALAKDPTVDKYCAALLQRSCGELEKVRNWFGKITTYVHERTGADLLLPRSTGTWLPPLRVDDLPGYRTPRIEVFQRWGVYGTYVRLHPTRRPLYMEFLGWSLEKLGNVMLYLTDMSRYSLRPGYPAPLFLVDRLTKIDRGVASAVATAVEYVARYVLRDLYVEVFKPMFRSEYEVY